MRAFLNLVALAVLGPPALIVLANLIRSDHRWPDILIQFTAPALMATVVVTVVYALLRLKWPALAGVVVAAGLLFCVWPQWFPKGPELPEDAPTIRVYSANVWIGNTDVTAMRRSIEAADPDVVMLIELGAEPRAQLDILLEGYPHRTETVVDPSRLERAVIAARFPLEEFGRRADGVHAMMARGQSPIGPINFVVAHLTRPWPYEYQWGQLTQVQALTARVKPLNEPVVIAGDFNSVTTGRVGRMIQADMELHPAPGWPGTWPSQVPSFAGITIDQVYLSRSLAVRSRRLGPPNGSDHRPVITEIGRLTAAGALAPPSRKQD